MVEVAATSLLYDRRVKAPLYARAGIPEYWIVDLGGEAIERLTDPSAGAYAREERLGGGATVTAERLGAPAVPVDELLDFALGR